MVAWKYPWGVSSSIEIDLCAQMWDPDHMCVLGLRKWSQHQAWQSSRRAWTLLSGHGVAPGDGPVQGKGLDS